MPSDAPLEWPLELRQFDHALVKSQRGGDRRRPQGSNNQEISVGGFNPKYVFGQETVAGPARFGGRALDRDCESRVHDGGKRRSMIDESLHDRQSMPRWSRWRFLPPGVFPG